MYADLRRLCVTCDACAQDKDGDVRSFSTPLRRPNESLFYNGGRARRAVLSGTRLVRHENESHVRSRGRRLSRHRREGLRVLSYRLQVGTRLSCKITGPDDKVIYSGERESNGKYTVAAHMEGVYVYCFGNKMSTMTPKTVMFSMDVGDAPKDANPDDADSNKDYGIYARFNYLIESVFKSIIISWKG